MKFFIIILMAIVSPITALADSFGWLEVEGRHVDLKYAFVMKQDDNLVTVVYSDKNVAPYLSNDALKSDMAFSGIFVEYNLECKNNGYECLNDFQFIVSATPEMLKGEIEDVKSLQPDFLWGGDIDFDNNNFVYTKNELSATAKSCPAELWFRGRAEVNSPTKVSFKVKGFPSNFKH